MPCSDTTRVASTCTLSLPAHHRQEVVTDDRGSSYPEGIRSILLQHGPLDGSEEIIQYSGDPQSSISVIAGSWEGSS